MNTNCTYIVYVFQTFFCYRNVDGKTTPGAVVFLICLIFLCATVNAQAIIPATTTQLVQRLTLRTHACYSCKLV